MAACNKEKQLAGLQKRKPYQPTSRNKGKGHTPKPPCDKQSEHKDYTRFPACLHLQPPLGLRPGNVSSAKRVGTLLETVRSELRAKTRKPVASKSLLVKTTSRTQISQMCCSMSTYPMRERWD